jgi:holdfast attachment protein HfaA
MTSVRAEFPVSPARRTLIGLAAGGLVMLGWSGVAAAQSYGGSGSSGAAAYQAGYGGARYTTARPQTGSTRDANGNRLIVDGIIQSGASSYSRASGAAAAWAGAGSGDGSATIGGATAIGNSLNVVVQGDHNTVIVNSTQINNGDINAGTALNGTLDLP